MKKKITLIVLILMITSLIFCANEQEKHTPDVIMADSSDVSLRVSDTLAYYHDFTLDHFWTGADEWAVKFDFTDYFVGTPAQFNAEAVWIYFPEIVNQSDLSLQIAGNDVNQPDEDNIVDIGGLSGSEISEGWNRVEFAAREDSIFWLLIQYETDNLENFLSGSAAEGEHSYYADDGYYYNFSAQGISSELLVCLEGNFILDKVDVELLDFSLIGEVTPGNTLSPLLVFRNDSDSYVDSVTVNINILSGADYTSLSVDLSDDLAVLNPNQTYTLDFSDDNSLDVLLDTLSAQYSITAEIECNDDQFTQNNSININFNLYEDMKNMFIVENIVDLDQTSNADIWQYEDDTASIEVVKILNYFPDANDVPFYTMEAMERFTYYELNGYPAVVIDGENKISGYWSDFDEDFDLALETAVNAPYTWMQYDSLYATYSPVNDSSKIELFFSNNSTKMLSSYITNSKFYAYLVEDQVNYLDENIPGYIMISKLKEVAQFGDNYGTRFSTTVSFKLSELPYISDFSNCKIIYFIQNEETKSMDLVGETDYLVDMDFEELAGSDSEVIPENDIFINAYPNPFAASGSIQLELPELARGTEGYQVDIFNIKGQKIVSLTSNQRGQNLFTWDGIDKNQKKSSTGIYFVRVRVNDNGSRSVGEKKILLLNDK